MKIGRIYRFEAAHYLPLMPEGHKCKRMHGHNYRVEIVLEGPVQENGFVVDFFDLDYTVNPVVGLLDHRLLNDIPGLQNPTAERIAEWFLAGLPVVSSVRVYENDDSWAEVERGEA